MEPNNTSNTGGVEVPPSPGWIRPSDVMRVRKMRAKRHALQARMSSSAGPLMIHSHPKSVRQHNLQSIKFNPFKRSPAKDVRAKSSSTRTGTSPVYCNEPSSDVTLFNLLHQPTTTAAAAAVAAAVATPEHYTFSQALRQQGIPANENNEPERLWCDNLPLDWSLKTKMRFIANKPLPWKHNFKTSEEASGTTGMARCLWGNDNTELDTSPNAEFYQRCLVWQHPSLPAVTLFPRAGARAANNIGGVGGGTIISTTGPYADLKLSAPLHSAWCEALRSLHQLLRVRQCPYFYVCAHTFTVLYRAAGICSIQQAHALVTPTTRGLRNAMREEGIDFKMPLCQSSDTGDGSCSSTSASSGASKTCLEEEGEEEEEEEEEGSLHDREEATSFLANLGVDTSQFANLNANRIKASSREIDRSPLSMVYIADPDTQGLTNFLLNSPSCVTGTGPLAGVPPTLLSPVAFRGASLQPFKVKGGSIRIRGEAQYSMEVTGPLLPHTPVQLSSLLTQHLSSFTVHTTPLVQTLTFTSCTRDMVPETMTKAFAEEGLVDCGLDDQVRSLACQPLRPPTEDTDLQLPPSYRQVTYEKEKYTWSDKQIIQQ